MVGVVVVVREPNERFNSLADLGLNAALPPLAAKSSEPDFCLALDDELASPSGFEFADESRECF